MGEDRGEGDDGRPRGEVSRGRAEGVGLEQVARQRRGPDGVGLAGRVAPRPAQRLARAGLAHLQAAAGDPAEVTASAALADALAAEIAAAAEDRAALARLFAEFRDHV